MHLKIITQNIFKHEYILLTLIFVNFIHVTQEHCGSWKTYNKQQDLTSAEIAKANALFSWEKCKRFQEISG